MLIHRAAAAPKGLEELETIILNQCSSSIYLYDGSDTVIIKYSKKAAAAAGR